MAGPASLHLTSLIAFPDRLGLGVGGQPRSQLLVPFIPLGPLKASLISLCPSSLLLAPLPPSRGSRQSTLVKSAVKARPSPVPLGCTWQRGPRREARGGAAPQARDPLREAGGSPGAECGSRACGAARTGREKDAPAEERRGRPGSREEPAAPERREPGNRDTFINVFSSRSLTFSGVWWGGSAGRESLLGLGIARSLLPGKIRTQTEADQPLESASNGNFSTWALGCGVAQTPGAAHPSTRTRGGFGRTPAVGGVDSALSELLAEGRTRGGAPRPLRCWGGPGARRGPGPAAPQATAPRLRGSTPWPIPRPDGPSPGTRVKAAHAMPPWAPRNLHYGETIPPGWPADLQSTAGNIPTPTHTSPGVHPEKEGKKSRGDPSQLERKILKRVSTAAKKPRLCRPSNDNKAFRRERGDRFPHGPDQKPGTPGHVPPLSGRENSSLPPEAPFLVLGKHSGR
ncbi:uncharacterized protein [Kogia breviceps]|uniref:uncharacterized protein isoform X2 n=1 Tax=Kogia breviceps TaxID=27615 RepID=UPI0034D1670E